MSIKAVMFDFDGTLSAPENSNIWNDFWDILDYERTPGSEYARLGGMFFGGEIDYQTWCDLTCEKFMERGFYIRTAFRNTFIRAFWLDCYPFFNELGQKSFIRYICGISYRIRLVYYLLFPVLRCAVYKPE